MKKQRETPPSKAKITKYWQGKHYDGDLMFSWESAEECCWNCGQQNKYTERAHIVAHSLGGSNNPENFVLLCKSCHNEAPDTSEPNDIWDWIKKNKTPFGFPQTYTLERALLQHKQEGNPIFSNLKHPERFHKNLSDELEKVAYHGRHFSQSTVYYCLKRAQEANNRF